MKKSISFPVGSWMLCSNTITAQVTQRQSIDDSEQGGIKYIILQALKKAEK
jgi:hypothetical protein